MTAVEVADLLNGYTGDNIWEDVIYDLTDYDPDATEAADQAGHSDVVVLTDGTIIRWEPSRSEWVSDG